MQLQKLDKRAKFLWLSIYGLIAIIIAGITVLCLLPLDPETLTAVIWPVAVPVGIIVALLISIPFIRYHFYSYGYDSLHVKINRGFIFKHKITIPVCQIQDLHIVEGPMMSLFGLSSIIFSTAGSNFSLAGLKKDHARQMVDEIEQYLNARIKEKENEEVL